MMKRSIRDLALLLVTLVLCTVVAAAAGDGTDTAIDTQAAVSTIRLTVPEGATVKLFDATGAEVTLSTSDGSVYTYRNLTPGAQYTYIATKDEYYHSSETLTAPSSGSKTWTVAAPKTADKGWLTELALGSDGTAKGAYALNEAFSGAVHSYSAVIPDTPAAVYIWVNGDTAATSFSVQYRQITDKENTDDQQKELTLDKDELGRGKNLPLLLMNRSGRGNTLTVRCSRKEGAVTYSQDYVITLTRRLSLADLKIELDGEPQPLTQADTGAAGFAAAVSDYTLNVPASAKELTVYPKCYDAKGSYSDNGKNGYHVWYGDRELTSGEGMKVSLEDEQTRIELRVTCDYAEGAERVYSVTVRKSAQLLLQPQLEPEEALLFVTDARSGNRIFPDAAGGYTLTAGVSYTYALTAPGYVGAHGTIVSDYDAQGALTLRAGDASAPVTDGTAKVTLRLTKAPASEQRTLPAQWADFRGTSYDANGTKADAGNNSVRTEKLPVRAEDSTLYWAEKIGDGYSSDAVSCPILVDGDLVVYAGTNLYRVDTVTGTIKARGTMECGSAHATVPPTYANGMILIPLYNGTIQAFDAQTLESLWVYHDALKGQPVCPITVCGDYLYVGFWTGETEDANFVCLTLTDEDPEKTNEEKVACWYRTQPGGFYWAGAYACEDYVLVGTDNGVYDGKDSNEQKACGNLLMLDARTGAQLDIWTDLRGDVRSTVCYDGDAFYFTTKGGLFCSVQTEQAEDGWRLKESSKWTLELTNGTSTAAMSTSTPVVYNGRAYVGVCGSSQFVTFTGHNLSVIDLETHSIAYKVETRGYTQTSGVLTTAYEKETGKVYVYFFDNYSPGVLRVLEDAPRQTRPSYLTTENGKSTAYVLFTPSGKQAQYSICSPIVDENGVLYFKNDSGYLMAFGPSVKLELTQQPEKTTYAAGDKFDATGMKAELVYANGSRRDVTDYVQHSTDALTSEDAEFTVRFPYVLYHDQEVDGVWTTNVDTTVPTATLPLTITGDAPTVLYGDVNGDGKIDGRDVTRLQQYIAGLLTNEEAETFPKQNADLNDDGFIDGRDVTQLLQYIARLIDHFEIENK